MNDFGSIRDALVSLLYEYALLKGKTNLTMVQISKSLRENQYNVERVKQIFELDNGNLSNNGPNERVANFLLNIDKTEQEENFTLHQIKLEYQERLKDAEEKDKEIIELQTRLVNASALIDQMKQQQAEMHQVSNEKQKLLDQETQQIQRIQQLREKMHDLSTVNGMDDFGICECSNWCKFLVCSSFSLIILACCLLLIVILVIVGLALYKRFEMI